MPNVHTLDNRSLRIWLYCTFIGLLLLRAGASTTAEEPLAVTLQYFRGTGLNQAVRLEWATATELSTAGFRFERSDSSSGPYLPLADIGFVPAQGDGVGGAEYEVMDENGLVNGQTYWYMLYEVEYDGSENQADPISVTAGESAATATATARATATATVSRQVPTASATATGTATPLSSPDGAQPTASLPSSQETATAGAATRAAVATSGALLLTATGVPTDSDPADFVAQALTPTAEGGYPGPPGASPPPPEVTLPPDGSGYPGAAELATSRPQEAYPSGNFGAPVNGTPSLRPESTSPPAPIGSGASSTQSPPEQEINSDRPPSSTFLLWVGFLTAAMVFAAGVVGSVVFFTRDRVRSRDRGN